MSTRLVRLFVACALLLFAAVSAESAARCVFSGGLSYCCWGLHQCRVCDSVKCAVLPASACPQACP